MTTAAKIQHMRLRKKISLRQLASHTGIPTTALMRFEWGLINLDRNQLQSIRRYLGSI